MLHSQGQGLPVVLKWLLKPQTVTTPQLSSAHHLGKGQAGHLQNVEYVIFFPKKGRSLMLEPCNFEAKKRGLIVETE